MIPVVDAFAVEVGGADLRPVFRRVRRGVGTFPQSIAPRVLEDGVLSLAPRVALDRAQRTVDRVAEFMDADAHVVIAIERQVQQILLAEAREAETAGAANAF